MDIYKASNLVISPKRKVYRRGKRRRKNSRKRRRMRKKKKKKFQSFHRAVPFMVKSDWYYLNRKYPPPHTHTHTHSLPLALWQAKCTNLLQDSQGSGGHQSTSIAQKIAPQRPLATTTFLTHHHWCCHLDLCSPGGQGRGSLPELPGFLHGTPRDQSDLGWVCLRCKQAVVSLVIIIMCFTIIPVTYTLTLTSSVHLSPSSSNCDQGWHTYVHQPIPTPPTTTTIITTITITTTTTSIRLPCPWEPSLSRSSVSCDLCCYGHCHHSHNQRQPSLR